MAVAEANRDGRLIERAQGRDEEAFGVLVRPHLARMLRTATAILGQEGDAADALQDTLVRAWRGLPRLRDTDRFEPWLTRILVNECRSALKRRSRARLREIDVRTGAAEPAGPGAADHLADGVVARVTLEAAFERLDTEARAIIVLHHLEGRSVEEIGHLLAIPVGTAKSRLHTARRSLDRALQR